MADVISETIIDGALIHYYSSPRPGEPTPWVSLRSLVDLLGLASPNEPLQVPVTPLWVMAPDGTPITPLGAAVSMLARAEAGGLPVSAETVQAVLDRGIDLAAAAITRRVDDFLTAASATWRDQLAEDEAARLFGEARRQSAKDVAAETDAQGLEALIASTFTTPREAVVH